MLQPGRKLMHTTSCWHSRARALASLATCITIAACADRVAGPEAVDGNTEVSLRRSAGRAECDAGNGGITLPPGFCAVVVADQVGLARHVTVRPNGDVYVALRRAPNGSDGGGILALRDTDGDGKANRKERFGTLGGTGIGWYK